MREWTPLETVWPSGVLALALLGALWFARREFSLSRRERPWMLGLLGAAFVIRWVWLPVVQRHFPDGHEADYFDRFTGLLEPTRGGTVMYPSMQWFWYLLGKILPHEAWMPSLVMVILSSLGVGLLVIAVGRLTRPEIGWVAGGLLALHPLHAAWSSSSYNVSLPFTLGLLGLASAAIYVGRHRPPESLVWVSSLSLGLAVATRLDSVVLAGPVLLLLAVARPEGVPLNRVIQDRARHLLGPLVAIGLATASIWPLVVPAEVPGAGERELSFLINWSLVDVHQPFDGPVGLITLLLATLLTARRWPLATAALGIGAVGNHLLMASFVDYADRHALMSLPGMLFVLSAAAYSLAEDSNWRRAAWAIPALGLGICLVGQLDMRERFYGTDDAFSMLLSQGEWAELPRVSLDEAMRSEGAACGWVSESSQAQSGAELSHFNLVRPEEAESHRGPGGCLRWCADVQDWRWSSRSVRDRALRLMSLYHLEAVAVLGEADEYQCLVLEVGERNSARPDHIPDWLGPRHIP